MVAFVFITSIAALIMANVIRRPDQARGDVAQTGTLAVAADREMYRLVNRMYATPSQGLETLVKRPVTPPAPSNWVNGRQPAQLAADPWSNPFIHRPPGQTVPFDLALRGRQARGRRNRCAHQFGRRPMTRRRDPQAGLTLIEVTVVLAIMAVMAGLATLSLGSLDRGTRAEAEARRLADRLQLASDEALVSSAVFALVWNESGYRFERWDPATEAWRPSAERLLGPRHTLVSTLRLQSAAGADTTPVLISSGLPPRAAAFVMTGGGAPWAVAFDGFTARATPARLQDD